MLIFDGTSRYIACTMVSDSHDRVELALQASNEGVWDWYVGDEKIYYSERALEFLGYPEESAPNLMTRSEAFIHPDDLKKFKTSFTSALRRQSDDIFAVDSRYHHPNGSWRWLRIRGVVVRDDTEKAIRLVGSVIDISKRKAVETELEEERHQLHQLVENIPVNIYYKDKGSKFVLSNSATAQKMGLGSVDELLGKSDHDFFDQSHADIARANEVKIMRTQEAQMNIVERETWDDKSDTWGETCKMPWLDSKGNVQGTFGITSDITEIVMTQQKLRRVAEELHARNQAIEEELQLAREIQQALLPSHLDEFTLSGSQCEISFSSRYAPASEMAGDFFEVIPISDDSVGVLICDVMGHGVRSSLVVSMIRGLMEKERESAVNPESFIYGINDGLVSILRRANVTLFASAVYCVINTKEHTLQYTSAGHPYPVIVKDGVSRQLGEHHKPEPALGLVAGASFTTESHSLDDIDRVLLFTDGLYEVENDEGEQLDMEKINSMMVKTHDMDIDMSLGFLIAQARLHSRYGEFDDDVCLVGMEISSKI